MNDPKHVQISNALRSRVTSGEIQPGEILATAVGVARDWGVSRMTARQALNTLVGEGLVTSVRGHHGTSGFKVVSPGPIRRLSSDRLSREKRQNGHGPAAADAESQGHTWSTEVIQLDEIQAPKEVAVKLNEDGPVFIRSRIISVNDQPAQLANSFIPLDLAVGAIRQTNTGPGGIYARFEENGVELTGFTERITARMPKPNEVEKLAIPTSGTPVVDLERTAYAKSRAVEVMHSVMRADRFEWIYDIPAR